MFNEILVGRFNKALNAIFGIKSGAPSPSLAGDVTAVYLMDQAADGRYQEGWARWAATPDIGPSVGNISSFELLNPPGSNVIAVVEKYCSGMPNAAAQTSMLWQLNTVSFETAGTFVNSAPLDGRIGNVLSTVQPVCKVTQKANAALIVNGVQILIIPAPAGTTFFDNTFTEHQEFVLMPGVALQCQLTAGNTELIGALWWRERPLEQSELR